MNIKQNKLGVVSIALVGMLVVIIMTPTIHAAPPHPNLIRDINDGKVAAPYFLSHLNENHEKGICVGNKSCGIRQVNGKEGLSTSATAVGDFRVLALLVSFSDNASAVTAVSFDSLIFDSVGNTVRDYYDEISYGQLDIVTLDLPSATGWQTAPQTYVYYVNDSNGTGSYPKNSQKLVEDLVDLVDGTVNFANYDNDGDGYVDVLLVIHAGSGGEYTGNNTDIWSHKWAISPRLVDGVYVSDYTVQPEFWTTPGDMTIGVYSHELGHGFGLPDLYDTDYSSNGIGYWGIMSYGSWLGPAYDGSSPAHPCAWSRIEMGFASALTITANVSGQTILNASQFPAFYRLWNSGVYENEYFLIENRQKTGYDSYLPGSGLLVWHIDNNKADNTQEWWPGMPTANHYRVALQPADGLFEMEQNVDMGDAADPFPGSGSKTSFTGITTPNSSSYATGATTVGIGNITISGSNIVADLTVGIVAGIDDDNVSRLTPSSIELQQNYPNPFNPTTTIRFSTTVAGQARLELFNVLGRKVATIFDGQLSAGENSVEWDAKDDRGEDLASGIYFYRLTTANGNAAKKMALLR